ncbi:hypothetical protein SDRG_00139 [Saprolegnia diclina VS20]|uniref:MARVEL domain-containing protein n=1 Tax=Saprolegnia diclina (strain VS20) TaxID=1156394 RepID=T0SAN6_SAPDV|nr:hypothetical protein SDRG_00139 [Saprolegnia diclina VS20]EQC42403.1 hypothetical protein SDRG_00139 [Saprolegnia diclina VS20]|eukprot:XP_008603826.1 hypothetical protein SDRG_00139 [Saprolegnia diclina VS20]
MVLVLRDECSLVLAWLVEGLCLLPALALTSAENAVIVFGVFALASGAGLLLSFSSTCRHRRACQFLHAGYIAYIFYTLQLLFVTVVGMSIYNFLLPFDAGAEFRFYCAELHLDKNLSGTSCAQLQGRLALALVVLTLDACVGVLMLVLGQRIAQKQHIEYTRVQKEIEKANQSPSRNSLLGHHV